MAKEFRFNAIKTFLTYSQTKRKMDCERMLKHLEGLAGVKDYLIAQERHKDGGYHIHAYVKFTEKLDTRSTSFFDMEYYKKTYHPNIQKPKDVHKVWNYIKKSGEFITNIRETRPKWLVLLEDHNDTGDFLLSLMWEINRIDNYAGYRTLRDLQAHIAHVKVWTVITLNPEMERMFNKVKKYIPDFSKEKFVEIYNKSYSPYSPLHTNKKKYKWKPKPKAKNSNKGF